MLQQPKVTHWQVVDVATIHASAIELENSLTGYLYNSVNLKLTHE